MKIEIIFKDQTETIELPPDIDIAGVSLNNSSSHIFNISTGFQEIFGKDMVEQETDQKNYLTI